MARAAPVRGCGRDYLRAAAFSKRLAVAIDVRPGDLPRAPHHHVVRALDALAAAVVRHEQVPPGVVFDDERGFHRSVDGLLAWTAAQRVESGIFVGRLAGLGVEPAHFDAAPKAA